MNKETLKLANDLCCKISNSEKHISDLEKIIKSWEKKDIDINKHTIVKDEKSHCYRLAECPTGISILDNSIGVQNSHLEIPIEAFRVALDYHKRIAKKLKEEFEKL